MHQDVKIENILYNIELEVEMFRLIINGSTENFPFAGEQTFGEVMEKLSRQITGIGEVITVIKMNDQPLTEGKQYDYNHFPLGSVETLELETTDPTRLALEALESSKEHLAMLLQNSSRTAELFRLGDELEANEAYSALVEGLRWLIKGLNAMTGMLGIKETEIILEGNTIGYYQDELLIPVFDSMYEAQRREDWVELADLLEYELSPALEKWDNLINAFKTRVAAA